MRRCRVKKWCSFRRRQLRKWKALGSKHFLNSKVSAGVEELTDYLVIKELLKDHRDFRLKRITPGEKVNRRFILSAIKIGSHFGESRNGKSSSTK
ncbi:hypothetical protein Tco_0228784 [Tanacetum coccineum]